jgi:hypothetical protein
VKQRDLRLKLSDAERWISDAKHHATRPGSAATFLLGAMAVLASVTQDLINEIEEVSGDSIV